MEGRANAALLYVNWLRDNAKLANQANHDVAHVARAYELARAATVPPEEIYANRVLFQELTSNGNSWSRKTAAIADIQARNETMRQKNIQRDVYAAETASVLITFNPPPAEIPKIREFDNLLDLLQELETPTVKLEQPWQEPAPPKERARSGGRLPTSSLRNSAY